MECQRNNEQIAYPVFYDVDPSEVRKQRGSYGEALAKYNNEDVEKWRRALQEAGGLSGYDLKNTADGQEAEAIKQIVEEISRRLLSTYYLSNDEKLVGMESRIPNLLSCLGIDSDEDVRMIGIKGMGGAGKTTLARAIFERISFKFEGVSFVDNVRENSKASPSGLQSLQEKILSNVLKEQHIAVNSLFDGQLMMKNRLCGIKALVVLDDVDDLSQLEALAGLPAWFKPGSRIIVTTRNEQVLLAHGVQIEDVNLLLDEEAICLLNMYAFKDGIRMEGYEEHSRKVVKYAAGLPLTVKVLGSLLRGQDENVWIDVLQRLKKIPLKETQEILELSYNSLEDDHKEIFLHVAFLLKGLQKKEVLRVLESCGFHATYGLTVLEQRSLITYSHNDGDYVFLDMHDHIQEMALNIIRRKHPDEPYKQITLWTDKEIEDGTEATRYVKILTFNNPDPEIIMKGLRGMKNLKFLHVYGPIATDAKCDEANQYCPNALQYLDWAGYPFCSLPKSFQAINLVALEMPYSKIEQLWEGGERKALHNLKFLDLRRSKLTKLDLGLTPNLEELELTRCYDLLEVDMSVGCAKLRLLDLSKSKLMKLDLQLSLNLEKLHVSDCPRLVELTMPVECLKLRSFTLDNINFTKLDLGLTPNLEVLKIYKCPWLLEPQMLVGFSKLRSLDLCKTGLMKLDLRLSLNLEKLSLDRCFNLVELYMPVECLKLEFLELEFLALKKLDLWLTPNLETLSLSNCYDLVELNMPLECLKLRSLSLEALVLKKLNLRLFPNLEKLDIHGYGFDRSEHTRIACRKLKSLTIIEIDIKLRTLELLYLDHIRREIRCSELTTLDLLCPDLIECTIRCSKLTTVDLGLTPNLERLILQDCHDLEELHMHVGCLEKLACLDLRGSSRLKYFVFAKDQESHELCQSDVESLNILSLDSNHGMLESSVSCFYKEQQFSSTGIFQKLISLGSCRCSNLQNIRETVDWLPNLKELILGCDIPEALVGDDELEYVDELKFSCTLIRDLPSRIVSLKGLRSLKLERCTSLEKFQWGLQKLTYLEKLHLSNTHIKHLPFTICLLKHLKSLQLVSCSFLEELPVSLGKLECLEDLIVQECKLLREIPNSIGKIKSLKRFHLPCCSSVEKLPEEIGDLESLIELNIVGTGIKHLPESITSLKDRRIIRYTWHLDTSGFTFASVQRMSEM